jgi:hypothetical protein
MVSGEMRDVMLMHVHSCVQVFGENGNFLKRGQNKVVGGGGGDGVLLVVSYIEETIPHL